MASPLWISAALVILLCIRASQGKLPWTSSGQPALNPVTELLVIANVAYLGWLINSVVGLLRCKSVDRQVNIVQHFKNTWLCCCELWWDSEILCVVAM